MSAISSMYSAALETLDDKGCVTTATIVYIHADSHQHAERIFRSLYLKEIMRGAKRIAAVGKAIGYFVQDEHGEVLAG